MVQSEGNVILITGASSGFGELTAKALAQDGHRVFATMRNVSTRNATVAATLATWAANEDVQLEVLELDVTDQASVDACVSRVIEAAGSIDVVVNNAGIAAGGPSEAFSMARIKDRFEVNTFGPVRVNQAVLPSMRAKGSGLIIHVTGTPGRIVGPTGGVFAPTKFAIEALAKSLHYELLPFGIDSVVVEPGSFPTGAMDRRLLPDRQNIAEQYAAVAQPPPGGMRQPETQPDPQDVAEAIRTLVDMPTGSRPLRTVVGSWFVAGLEELNEAYSTSRAMLLRSLSRET